MKLFDGNPTGPDVQKLIERFGAPEVGTKITHEEVAELIGCEYREPRYRSVTVAWRRRLLERDNIDLRADPGQGFTVMDSEQRIVAGVQGTKMGVRKVLRSAKRADRANTDDPRLVSAQNGLRRFASVIAAETTQTLKQISMTPPRDQLPRGGPKD